MRNSYLVTMLAALGWAFLTPGSWVTGLHAQTTILSASGMVDTSQPCPTRGPNFYQRTHTIAVIAGNQYTIDLRSTAADSNSGSYASDCDTYLYLPDSAGTIVAENDDVILGGGGTGTEVRSLILYNATASGNYTIIVTSWSSGVTFPYNLTVTARGVTGSATGTTAPPPAGTPLPPSLPAGSNVGLQQYSLTVGQTYVIDATGAPGSGGGFNDYIFNTDTVVYLMDSSGAVVASDTTSLDPAGIGYGARITYTAPATGQYTVVVSSFNPAQAISYQITISTPQTAPGTPPAPPAPPAPPGGAGIPNVRVAPRLEGLPLGTKMLG